MRAEALERRGAVTVLAYICDHPGCIQEDIIQGRTDIETPGGKSARMDAIKRLLDAGLIKRGGRPCHTSYHATESHAQGPAHRRGFQGGGGMNRPRVKWEGKKYHPDHEHICE